MLACKDCLLPPCKAFQLLPRVFRVDFEEFKLYIRHSASHVNFGRYLMDAFTLIAKISLAGIVLLFEVAKAPNGVNGAVQTPYCTHCARIARCGVV